MSIPGRNIKFFREQLGLSVRGLALAAGVDAGNLSRIEAGDSWTSRDTIESIAEALHVSTSLLFSEPELVEAATLQVRKVPILKPVEIVDWKGPDGPQPSRELEYLYTRQQVCSRYSFAIRVEDRANLPRLYEGDELIFDMNQQPVMGDLVIAQDSKDKLCVGRLRSLPTDSSTARMFEVLPYDVIFPSCSTLSDPGLKLRGTLAEHRRYGS